MKYVLYLFSILALTASACDKNGGGDEPVSKNLSVSVTEISTDQNKSTQAISVTADCDWGVSSADKSWCTVSPSGGVAGTATVTVNIAENTGKTERETAVNFYYGTQTLSVPVKQAAPPKEEVDTSIKAPEGYSLVWHDEFEGTKVDTQNWKFENWAPGYVNNELQRYVAGGVLNGNYTAYIEDGVLMIKAMKVDGQVISARMNTRKSWKYGYMEARINLPSGKGTWPAFWMMPNDQSAGWPKCGEIDIMEEVGYHPNYTSSSIHTQSYNHTINTQKTKEVYTKNAEGEFHVYALEWTPDEIKSYVDGKQFFSFKNDGTGNVNTWPFDKTFYITLNLAWGGSWGGAQGVNEAALPAIMQVDYVRVFQKD